MDIRLTDGVIVLDRATPDDAPAILAATDDRIRWAWWDSPAQTLDSLRAALERPAEEQPPDPREIRLAIRLAGAPGLIGRIGLHPSHWGPGAVLDIWLADVHQGHGIGRRAVRLAVSYGFETLALPWIEAEIRPGNGAALHLVKAAGFERSDSRQMTDRSRSPVHVWHLGIEKWRTDKSQRSGER